jgi:heme iron utilization protein
MDEVAMDQESLSELARLLRTERVAALGTLRQGAPVVSMVLYAPARDFSELYLHVSRLAFHTQNILVDPRVSLMVRESDSPSVADPQMLARVSIQGEARPVDDSDYEEAKQLYLSRFPEAAQNFTLGDFSLFGIVPRTARFVAGFGRIFNLTGADVHRAGSLG